MGARRRARRAADERARCRAPAEPDVALLAWLADALRGCVCARARGESVTPQDVAPLDVAQDGECRSAGFARV